MGGLLVMSSEPESIASIILARPDVVSKLRILDPGDLQIELWHVVAEIAGCQHQEMPDDTAVPDINELTRAVLPIVVAALGKCADAASTA
jgi:hypothetical protein